MDCNDAPMKVCLAGSDGSESVNKIIESAGARNRLESFHSLKKKPPSMQFDLVLDSGGFVARIRGVEIDVQTYIDYVNKHKVKKAFNLDTADVAETLENQKKIMAGVHKDCTVIPVYHLSDYLGDSRELLDDYCRDFDYISIGGIAGVGLARRYEKELYSYIFKKTTDKIKVHGLGITSKKNLELYPFYSVDSTSWLAGARYGRSAVLDNEMLQKYYSKKRHYTYSYFIEAKYWVSIEKYATKLWKLRGIEWSE